MTPHTDHPQPQPPADSATTVTLENSGATVELEQPCPTEAPPQEVSGPSKAALSLKMSPHAVRQLFAESLDANFGRCGSLPQDAGNDGSGAKPHYRGVTRHKRTQRYESHIWESKKQIYLGGFDSLVLAAKSHDIMALRCKGTSAETLNFPHDQYTDLTDSLFKLSKDDVITALRNYSKAHVAKKAHQAGGAPRAYGVGVKKTVRSPKKTTATGATNHPAYAVYTPRKPSTRYGKFRVGDGMDLEGSTESEGSGHKGPLPPGRLVGTGVMKGKGLFSKMEAIKKETSSRYGAPHRLSSIRVLPSALVGHPSKGTVVSNPIPPVPNNFHLGGSVTDLTRAPSWGLPTPFIITPPAGLDAAVGKVVAMEMPAVPAGGLDDALEGVDMDALMDQILEEPSLTYSASKESCLYESLPPINRSNTHVLEHVNGVTLMQDALPQTPKTPQSRTPLAAAAAAGDKGGCAFGAQITGFGIATTLF